MDIKVIILVFLIFFLIYFALEIFFHFAYILSPVVAGEKTTKFINNSSNFKEKLDHVARRNFVLHSNLETDIYVKNLDFAIENPGAPMLSKKEFSIDDSVKKLWKFLKFLRVIVAISLLFLCLFRIGFFEKASVKLFIFNAKSTMLQSKSEDFTGNGKLVASFSDNVDFEYIGEIVDGSPQGEGSLLSSNGKLYEGDFVNGKFEGNGFMNYPNGATYNGQWKAGKREGKGKDTWANGTIYEGDFVNDKYEGKGKLDWSDGNIYEGDFVNGKYQGKGKLLLSDGNIYEGDFVDGNIEGIGKLTRKDGTIEYGEWKESKLVKKLDLPKE